MKEKIKKTTEPIIITAAEKTIYVTFRGHTASDTHSLIALFIFIDMRNMTGKQAIAFEHLKRKICLYDSLFASSILLHSYVKCECCVFFSFLFIRVDRHFDFSHLMSVSSIK